MNILAQINGDSLIHSLLWLVVVGVILGFIVWLVDYCGVPQPINKGIKIVIALVGVLVIINVLLSLVGHPIYHF